MLVGSFASTYYGAARSTQNIDLMIRAIPAQLRICSESAQRGILCRLGCPGKLSCGVHFEFSFIAHGGGAAFCDYSLDNGQTRTNRLSKVIAALFVQRD